MSPAHSELDAAYAHCEALTREQAANFYYGIRLLSGERRRAMCAVYAFSREVDDIGDGGLDAADKLRRLDACEASLSALNGGGGTPEPGPGERAEMMIALADACERFPIPVGALRDLIEGVRMDVRGVSYEQFDELVLYCRRVAGAIGRVCLAIFAMRDGERVDRASAEALADDLGVALQLTNILRDVREDAENGRVYLPYEDLRRFGLIGGEHGAADGAPERLAALAHAAAGDGPRGPAGEELERIGELVRFEAGRARQWFARGGQLAPLLDRRSPACLLAMAGIYRRLLDRIEAQPLQALGERMSLPAREKAWVAARGLLGAPL